MLRRPRATALLASATFLALVACGGSSGDGTQSKSVRIILGHLRFAPSSVTVEAGTTVRFVLANSDAIDHEFVLGSEDVQNEHARMRMGGGHMMDSSGAVSVPPSKTVELTHTFDEPGTVLYGCHVADHYEQGMKGTVTVT
ncbi:MAG: plastocyanin/azurin family copper-binding protein [Actinomycetota bacterium]